MESYRKPDATIPLQIDGHRVLAYSFGEGPEVLFCLTGGPGAPCDYVRDSHSHLADHGYRVVVHDQLGTGASDRPKDLSLWRVERFVAEVETVRQALGLGRVHLLGQSWGGMLALEYALAHPEGLKTLISVNGLADTPLTLLHMERLRSALGAETVAMMARHEADGTTDHPEYKAAVTILEYRHLCRLAQWPAALQRSHDGMNMDIYGTMWGPNEMTCIGTLKQWSVVDRLHLITHPALVLSGLHDEVAPPVAAQIKRGLPHAEIKVFPNSSHQPFFEEPEDYFSVLRDFLDRHRG
jgi:proline iminopeptidase